MRCVLAIAVLLAGLALPSSLEAQRRSAPRSIPSGSVRIAPGFSGHPAPRPVGMGPVRMAPVRTGIVMPSLSGQWRHGGSGGRFFRPRFFPRRRFFVQPWLAPTFWYPPFYSPWSDSQPAEEAPAPPPEQNDALANQVERLTDEVERLREERAESRPPAAAPQSAVDEKAAPAVLVYRDGHRDEAQNYAVLGQTVWVFGEQGSRRIALADLDLEATKRLNDERGVEFVPPHSP